MTEPTKEDLESPIFNAVWNAIKKWDIQREYGKGYAGATGTDVMTILEAIKCPWCSETHKCPHEPPSAAYEAGVKSNKGETK
jgi:hypothetical protein